ncbi:MAG: hypothetical protein QM820_06120 [Minicystis sp.]
MDASPIDEPIASRSTLTMRTNPSLLAVASVLALTASCASPSTWRPSETSPAQPAPARADGIAWEIVDRFRLLKQRGATEELFRRYASYYASVRTQVNDAGVLETHWNAGDGHDGHYDEDYLRIAGWQVRLTAPATGQCVWAIGSPPTTDEGPCQGHVRRVGVGETRIAVRPKSGSDQTWTTVVHPRDVLIATLGDSYASGEGVPDLRGFMFTPARWMDDRCHRSLFSGPGLAALMYAKVNPHVSVTHLTFACSGAQLQAGLLHGYDGQVPPRGAKPLPPQAKELNRVLREGGRTADYVTLSFGGNDLGFSDIVTTAAFHGVPELEGDDPAAHRGRAATGPGVAAR